MNSGAQPDWDIEQIEVILDDPASWQLVVAGPGCGKSAVACQRVAYLVDEGIPPSRILLISFTRTAVAELRDRIVSFAVAGDLARQARISTIDSHAWSLRVGFDDEPSLTAIGNGYDLSIARLVELFQEGHRELLDFMARLEHLIVDEAQDVMGIRAELVISMLRALSDTCGVTVLADPAQAIYGFTTDDAELGGSAESLLDKLESDISRTFVNRHLRNPHRIQDHQLTDVFERTRSEVEQTSDFKGHVRRVVETIRETCGKDLGQTTYENMAELIARLESESVLVLFRRRADVLFVSSYCSARSIAHRLRLSGAPTVVRPWLGWLFGEYPRSLITKPEFDALWSQRASLASAPFERENCDVSWALLHRLAASYSRDCIDLVRLRHIVARSRPPVELCYPDVGLSGPILGTIHASKGREADTVLLVMPATHPAHGPADKPSLVLEEGRVYYVGATRARTMLLVAQNSPTSVSYFDSRRVYRLLRGDRTRLQLEVGRDQDVDTLTHLAWTNSREVQHVLASVVGQELPVTARACPEHDYALRLELAMPASEGVTKILEVGELGVPFRYELNQAWSIVDGGRRLRPAPAIQHLHLVAVTTVALRDEQLSLARLPFSRTGFALAPVIKGFPTIPFIPRRGRRSEW